MPPSTDKYLPWFVLREIPGLSNRACKQLLIKFESPTALLAADPGQFAIDGVSPKAVKALSRHKRFEDQARASLNRVLAGGYKITTLTDSHYPALLKEIPDPPLMLIYDGSFEASAPCISIVGSRKATRYGLDTAEYLARKLSQKGFTVVSGMALGIDSAAHKGALNAGTTIAVLGSGLNHIYPRQNKDLYQRIRIKGAILSEFDPDTPPRPGHFPQRNRVIAGISVGTIVVEAAQRSGSLITARLSGEYNREVFAVPGSVRSSVSRGTHTLIRQGAKLVENENDIIDELGQFIHSEGPDALESGEKNGEPKKALPVMDKTQMMLYNLLDPYPIHIDQITSQAGMEARVTAAALLDMELSGLILRHPGNYYSKSEE